MDQERKRGTIPTLLDFAGERRGLIYLGCAFSAVAMAVNMLPYVCVWLAVRDLVAVAPNWQQATSVTRYGWMAFGFAVAGIVVYFCALMCTHLAAFRTATNIRKRCMEHLAKAPLGYFDSHASGLLRRRVDGAAAQTETLLAHNLVDITGTVAMFVTLLVLLLVFDWRMGAACLLAVAVSLVIGGLLGIVPQCGFSAAAASLFSGGVISLGTLLAVFLSTSDEMLPIFISSADVGVATILRVVIAKVLIGLVTGIVIDLVITLAHYRMHTDKHIHDLCEQEHCGCEDEEGGIIRSALVHTLKITFFIFIVSFVIAILVGALGENRIAGFLSGMPYLGVFLSGIIGLIPNCAASVMITQMYLAGLLGAGQMMSGLLVGAGVGLLVLFQTSRHWKENIKVLVVLYAAGVCWGLLIEALHISF